MWGARLGRGQMRRRYLNPTERRGGSREWFKCGGPVKKRWLLETSGNARDWVLRQFRLVDSWSGT